MRDISDTARARTGPRAWWSDAVIYRVDVRAFDDSDGDGVGDLNGVRERLGYLELLGVDAVWMTGVLAGPVGKPGQAREVDPILGDLTSFDRLVAETHASGLRVAIDIAVTRHSAEQPEVHEELERTLRFWMDRGVDGFRLGAAPGMAHPADDATHRILRTARAVVGESPQRLIGALVREWSTSLGNLEALDVGLDLGFCAVRFQADAIRATVERVRSAAEQVGAVPVWGLADWDHPRPVTRLGGNTTGLARARAMALVQCALPGVIGVDNGNELGLPESASQDGMIAKSIRAPIPWEGAHAPFGFSDAPGNWSPIPDEWSELTVEAQLANPASTLSLYREALRIRHNHPAFSGDRVEWYGAPEGCLAFRRSGGNLVCALNTAPTPVPMPPGAVLLSSRPLDSEQLLPVDTAVWLV
ncbi:alpha-glucosidase [Halopolyspora algeriensis]|uniref:Alpha-glucosidase n=1 Tax=Halopolyspora algeriensis TaxID=1500506 RepID=A0A368VV95_9ACTN|nr:alpha-glucosidase [Halopolyspora algeriensis]TQM53165.1 alpha-glucosidase [Halopolyspora algeriensis]